MFDHRSRGLRVAFVAAAVLVAGLLMDSFALAAPPCGWGGDRPCGPEWLPGPLKLLFPQQVGGADLRPACRAHDQCYTAGIWSRRSCDLAFRDNMLGACAYSRRPIACRATAQVMFISSRLFGRAEYGGW